MKWIKTDNRLPAELEEVLFVYVGYGTDLKYAHHGVFFNGEFESSDGNVYPLNRIWYWMKCPKPPENDSEVD